MHSFQLVLREELERCRKRLGSLASVRPAFMDEPGGRKQKREAEEVNITSTFLSWC